MRITALALDGNRGWPDLRLDRLDDGLNVFHGPAGSAKTTLADLVAHALYGRRLTTANGAEPAISPEGELLVESQGRQYRLRRYHGSGVADRLTVAALDAAAVDRETVRQLVHGLSPSLLSRLFVVNFGEPNRLDRLLSEEFTREYQAAFGAAAVQPTDRRPAELLGRRDALAEQLEAHFAGRRQKSRELDERWQELDQLLHERKQQLEQLRDRVRAVDTELAEIDSWLRCRQIESVDDRQPQAGPADWQPQLADLDEQIARWRWTLAELDGRQADVRARLAQLQPNEDCVQITLADQRAGLAAARKLVTDLQGEVARLAVASRSHDCVCRDAHPRLRPVVETLVRQLDRLDEVTRQQETAARAADLAAEVGHLARSQAELRSQLEHLLGRRRSLERSSRRRWPSAAAAQQATAEAENASHRDGVTLAEAAPVQELACRRIELLDERGLLHDQLAQLERQLRDLRTEHDRVERQRTEVLSPRAIRGLEQDLAEVQRQLEHTTNLRPTVEPAVENADGVRRASDFLAQITDGQLVQLWLAEHRRETHVVGRSGDSRSLDSLSAAERDQVEIALRLALVSAGAEQGVRLPLVLDDPFEQLDDRATTALAAVIDDFGRRGQQTLLFTAHSAAVKRFAALGATLHDMADLFRRAAEPPLGLVTSATVDAATAPRRRKRRPTATSGKRTTKKKRREAS